VSPTIRIDEEVFDELKKHAEPFIDTPNSVLRRLLGLSEARAATNGSSDRDLERDEGLGRSANEPGPSPSRHRRRRSKTPRAPRAKTGTILAEAEYEIPMLEVIAEHGDLAAAREVLDELETRLGGLLTEVDKEPLASGDIRWRNRAQFVRLRLVEQGDLVKNSPRGIWALTEQGRRRIADAA
jgi:hypothetical protein